MTIRRALVIAFVAWHSIFWVFQNIEEYALEELGLETALEPIVNATARYEQLFCLDQGWMMFTSPLSRTVPFPSVRLEFFDGSTERLLSINEPNDPARYIRRGEARLRKYEHRLITSDWEYTDSEELWKRYLNWRTQLWRAANPDDARRVKNAVLVRRTFELVEAGDEPELVPTEEDVYRMVWLESEPGSGPR